MFPSPVGGGPSPKDFAPAIVFIVLYALLLPLVIYRMVHKKTRTLLLVGSAIIVIERVVMFSLRASQAHSSSPSKQLSSYIQWSLGTSFITISQDLVNHLRCILVGATYGSEKPADAPVEEASRNSPPTSTSNLYITRAESLGSPNYYPDNPSQRAFFRRIFLLLRLSFFPAEILAIIAGSSYKHAMTNESKAHLVMITRYASTGLALILTIGLWSIALWAYLRLPHVNRNACLLIIWLTCVVHIPAIYRLDVMFHTTDSLTSTAAGSLNSPASRITFYIFHIAPEWLAVATLFAFNVRQLFGTGPMGDRMRDETPEEKAKRLEKANRRNRETGGGIPLVPLAQPGQV